ncbi:MAG: hypothetical protein ACTHKG_02530 [Nocardioides sp.]
MRAGLLVVALCTAACGPTGAGTPSASGPSSSGPGSAESPSGWWSGGPADEQPRYRGIGTVLDAGDGPELCLGPIMTSLPPRCSGPKLVGWTWDGIESEHRAGTRWTGPEYLVTGTFEPRTRTLTLIEPPVRSDEYDGPWLTRSYDEDRSSATPCPEPAGGWRPVDPARTSDHTLQQVAWAAERLDGFAELWWDQSINPAHDDPDADPGAMNDPAKLVVNVRLVGDVVAAEQQLREVWGGALCVTQASRTAVELRRIQNQVARTSGMFSASASHDVVDLDVEFDDGSLQRRFDEEYGEGVVRVHSALFPLSPGD